MYIIAIGWIFVTLLMALTETGFIAGILSFTFYGLLPLALFLWLFGTPQRRRNRVPSNTASEVADDEATGHPIKEANRHDPNAER